jgi:dienelactone hydrolase
MIKTASDDHYFMYFPGNYRWSAGFLSMLSCSTWGGADIGEVDRIGRILKAAPKQTDEAWFDACVKVGKETHAHAVRYEKSGHRVSAAPFYLRACKYYQMAERFRTPKDAIALEIYQKSIDCFHAFTRMSDVKIDIVEVPFVDGSLPGYFVQAQNSTAERKPAVVFFDGLDVTKELLYMRGVPDLIKRGISVLIMDGPGTGEAIRFRKHYLRHDYEVAGSACVDWLEKRADVNPKKIGIVANSLGGYYSPRCASMEPRFAACIAWGAIWDYHATWKRRIDAAFNAAMSVPGHHITWILGVNTVQEALKKLEPYRLDGVVQKMRCPFLVAHGSEDEQVPLADAQALYNACGSKDKTLRVFTPEEGGAQHCMRDYAVLGVAEMWNWFEDKLVRN